MSRQQISEQYSQNGNHINQLDLLIGMREDLAALAEHVEEFLRHADEAVEFVGHRVEQARVRERRRNRRGARRAVWG